MEIGKRTVISIFEYKAAHEPESIWALRPKDNDNLNAGFESITYQACMEAVNRAAQWLQDVLPSSGKTFDAFAYQGPSDLRVLLLCLAAAKVGKQIMLPSRRASSNAQQHLVKAAGCVALIHAQGTDPMFDYNEIGAKSIVAPELSDWLFATGGGSHKLAPFNKAWSDAQNDPWILLHTSGTTGLPKIVCYTQKMMTKFDAKPPVDEGPTPTEHFGRGSWFTSIPLFHFVGLCIALQYAPICGSVCIAPPVIKGPPVLSGQQLIDLIAQTTPHGLVLPPADIEKLTHSEEGWIALRKVKCINFVGAQLRKSVGDRLLQNGNVVIYGLGTTEAGGYPQLLRSDSEWDWFTLPDSAGATFERYPSNDDVYELVFYKQPGLERFQQVFLAFPNRDVYKTNDLYYKHPTLKNTWKIAGRSDDFFKLASGYGVFATPYEESLLEKADHLISAALIAGDGRDQPCLLVAPKKAQGKENLINAIWPVVEEVNTTTGDLGHIKKTLILVADPAKPFRLNGKGAVSRRDTLREYDEEVEALYNGRK